MSPSSRYCAPVQDNGIAGEEVVRGPVSSGHLWPSRGHRQDRGTEGVPFKGSTAAGEERGGGERWRQEEDRDGRAVVLSGEAATPVRGQVGGAADWNEGASVDVVGGGEEARVGRNHAEAEAAMVDDGEQRRDEEILVTK